MTAHDPRVTLTEAERDDFRTHLRQNLGYRAWVIEDTMLGHVERIIAARLAPIRALIADFDGWEIDEIDVPWIEVGRLRKALDAPQDAPRGPVGGEQGAEVCWSCDGTGSLRGGQHDGEACPACTEEGKR